MLDPRAGDPLTGRAGRRQPRRQVREILPGGRGVQLPGQPRHLRAAGRGDARDVQVDPLPSVREERAEGSVAGRNRPGAAGTRFPLSARGSSPGRLIGRGSRVLSRPQEAVDFVQKSEEREAKSDDNENSWGLGGV